MRITETTHTNFIAKKQKTSKTKGTGFSELIDSEDEKNISEISQIFQTNNLLDLQEISFPQDKMQEKYEMAKKSASDTIKLLKNLKIELLSDKISQENIAQIQNFVKNHKLTTNSPELNSILSEINILCAVELAKAKKLTKV